MRHASRQLGNLGSIVRAARVARGFTQQQVAARAGVSRAHLVELEKGANVSILFLLKVAHFLDLSRLPLDGAVEISISSDDHGVDVLRLLQLLDVAAGTLDEIRLSLFNAVLPPAERLALVNTAAVKAFVDEHAGEAASAERMAEALASLGDGGASERTPKPPLLRPAARAAKKRRS